MIFFPPLKPWKKLWLRPCRTVITRKYFKALAFLKTPVDKFFDEVLVMTDDLKVRANRLALLVRISQTFLRLADFSRISIS